MASESHYKGSNAPAVRCPLMDKKDEARPLTGVMVMLCIPFSVLTLMFGWQERHPAYINHIHKSQRFT